METNVNKSCICSLMDKQIINAGAGSYRTSTHWHCPVHGMQHREFEKPKIFKSQEERGCERATNHCWQSPDEHRCTLCCYCSAKFIAAPKREAQGENWIREMQGEGWYIKLGQKDALYVRAFIAKKIEEAREEGRIEEQQIPKNAEWFKSAVARGVSQTSFEAGKLAAYQEVREQINKYELGPAETLFSKGYNTALTHLDAWAVEKLAANDKTI